MAVTAQGLKEDRGHVTGRGITLCVQKLPIRPDAFFTIEDRGRLEGERRGHFFLEADRSTATHTRFKEKIQAYWHYLEQELHAAKFGIKTFRVLTMTLTEARVEYLSALAASLLPQRGGKHYLFTSLKKFSLEDPAPVFSEIYFSPRPGGANVRYPLIPPPKPSQTDAAVV